MLPEDFYFFLKKLGRNNKYRIEDSDGYLKE